MKTKYLLLFLLAVSFASAYTTTNYTSATTYTVPSGVTHLFVEAFGVGGVGGDTTVNVGAGGGGGGAYAASIIAVAQGQQFNLSTNTAYGANSWFNNTTSLYVLAAGGINVASDTAAGGAGGTVAQSTGQIEFAGGSGGTATGSTPGSGGGGAGTYSAGTNGTTAYSAAGGAGGSLYGGAGGAAAAAGAGNNGVTGSDRGGGGGGSWRSGAPNRQGGFGGQGVIRISELTSLPGLINFTVRNINNLSVENFQTNITLQNFNTLETSTLTSSNGLFYNSLLGAGVYNVQVSATNSTTTHGILTVVAGINQSVTYYVDSSAVPIIFYAVDTLGGLVDNASISFSTSINGSVVVFAQQITDFTGGITVNLREGTLYTILGVEPSGAYNNLSQLVIPQSASSPYSLPFTFNTAGTNYPSNFDNVYTAITAGFNNTTSFINVTWEVISPLGELDWFSLNTSYNGSVYSQNISGSPGGGIAFVNISGVDLSVQDSINVTFLFQKTGYTPASNTFAFTFSSFTADNSSLTGGLFTGNNVPSTGVGKAILATIIIFFVMAAAGIASGVLEISVAAGLVTLAVLSRPTIGMLPEIFGLISLITGILVLVAAVVNKR